MPGEYGGAPDRWRPGDRVVTVVDSNVEGPPPTGGGPSVSRRREAALAAMLRQADREGMAVTIRQIEGLLAAAVPHLAEVRVEERVVIEVDVRECRRIHARRPTLSTNVPAGPTIAALQELVASGFPLQHLARMLQTGGTELTQLMQREHVRPATERRVLELGERLRGTDPLQSGVTRQGMTRARNHAARRGWTSPGLAPASAEVG